MCLNHLNCHFFFSPDAYILPLDYTKLIEQCSSNMYEKDKEAWIYKPVGLSQGRGISIFRVCNINN